ncbi:hypothetical protein [Streptomyces sp. NPDC059533]|uniref:hypothetical protein n=1 Tax=unclassified Streptomyces TaxID=2593676 RepID=UPI00368C3C9C
MATAPRPVPKAYPTGTGRPTTRELDEKKLVRTVNVTGTVWDAGKKRAGEDEVSISHAVGVLIEGYAAGLLDLDAIVAQLDARAADDDQEQDQGDAHTTGARSPGGAWSEEAPSALAASQGWGAADDVPHALDILDGPRHRP